MRILDMREITKLISSPIRNAYIDFSKMTASLVSVVTDVERNGRRVVGYGFNSKVLCGWLLHCKSYSVMLRLRQYRRVSGLLVWRGSCHWP